MALSLVILLVQAVVYVQSQNPVIPSHFNYTTLAVLAANGSSATGNCPDVPSWFTVATCSSPASSVLFDGVIPTLTALDGNTWARQLMILQRAIFQSYDSFRIFSSFANARRIRRVEVVLFNCPQWGTAVHTIYVTFLYPGYSSYEDSTSSRITVISCDSLVKVCIPVDTTSVSTAVRLSFGNINNVHLAEVSFYEDSSPCPPFTIIPGNWTPPQENERLGTTNDANEQTSATTLEDMPTKFGDITTKQTSATMLGGDTTEQVSAATLRGMRSSEAESSDKSLVIVLSVLAMMTALQTTVIFLVVLVVVCKYDKRKATPKHPDITKPVEMEDQLYETVDPGERGVSQKRH